MNKVEVKIDALSFATNSTGSYLIILADININRKLPIVINPSDAQFIAIKHNKINITKPMTPEIFKTLTDIYQIDIQEVYIYAYEQGSFFARLVSTNQAEVYEVDCTISTALTMSVVYNCPIFINGEIMDAESSSTDEEGNLVPTKKERKVINGPKIKIEKLPIDTVSSLTEKLKEAVDNEDYELAVTLRNRIEKLKK